MGVGPCFETLLIMKRLLLLATSSLGRKYLVALTGAALVAFVIIHMLGNLQIFAGADVLNQYAVLLQSNKFVLWGFRLGLLATVVVHIGCAISLAVENKRARPSEYVKKTKIQASLASLTMVASGLIVLAFIVFHLLHFTVKAGPFAVYEDLMTQIGGRGPLVPDVYAMVVQGFSNPWIAGFYIISVGLLSVHLSHGVSSIFQSLGLRTAKSARLTNVLAYAVSATIFVGMAAVPIAVLMGLGRGGV
jgi:succinate dehydrogenase / fumarate reductase cytochrome b subunit